MVSLTEAQRAAIRSLCDAYGVTRLDMFGSATRDDFEPHRSDIDLLVEFAPTADLGPWLAHFWALQHQLEAVLERKVDLVMAEGVRNRYLQRSINQDRRALYAT